LLQTATKAKTPRSKAKPPKRKARAASSPQLSESDEEEKENHAEEGSVANASAARAGCSTEPELCGRGFRKKMKKCDIYAYGK
jgi:hypothetical protein